MNDKQRIIALTMIMLGVAVAITISVTWVLYQAFFEQQRSRLLELVQSQAGLINSVAYFDKQYSAQDVEGGAFAATLKQVRGFYSHFEGLGQSGEFTLAKLEGNSIAFVLDLRHLEPNAEKLVIPLDSNLAEPMRKALAGESGTLIGRDYRSETVLAAYTPVTELKLGLVAKIDLSELRAPFIKAASWSGAIGIILSILGVLFFRHLINPFIDRLESLVKARTNELEARTLELENSLDNLRRLQRNIIETEKMAALGGLVAGVAHEVNTPLGVGVSMASLLDIKVQEYKQRYEDGQLTPSDTDKFMQVASDSSQMIVSNLIRAADLIRSFKQVAVDQSCEEKRRFNLKQTLLGIIATLNPLFKRTQHEIHVECPDNIEMFSYPGALSQIITNFVSNSLTHGFDAVDKGNITISAVHDKHKVLLTYHDDGNGIPAGNLNKIFEPFFTTRRGDGGSGLGLHIIYNLATHTLEGEIECSSDAQRGTTFYLRINDGMSHLS